MIKSMCIALAFGLGFATPVDARGSDTTGTNGTDATGMRATDGIDTTGVKTTGHTGSVGRGTRVSFRAPLFRSVEAVETTARGRVEVRMRGGRERMRIKAQGFASDTDVKVYLENRDGLLQRVADAVVDSSGRVRVDWDSRDDYPPIGVESMSELQGREILIATAQGRKLLEGTVPMFDGANHRRFRARLSLATQNESLAPFAQARLVVKSRPMKAKSQLRLKLRRLPMGLRVPLFISNPESGTLAFIDAGESVNGRVDFRFDTDKRFPLPFSVRDVVELRGERFEVRTDSGEILFAGEIPAR